MDDVTGWPRRRGVRVHGTQSGHAAAIRCGVLPVLLVCCESVDQRMAAGPTAEQTGAMAQQQQVAGSSKEQQNQKRCR